VAGRSFAQWFPWLAFPLVSGALVDRLDRRRVMGYVGACRATLVGVLGLVVLFDATSLPLMYAALFS
jgi:hypothetical protein